MTFDFIVNDILLFVSIEDKEYLMQHSEKDLIRLHHSFGRNIRNKYKLWETPLDDIKYKDKHPDDISMDIIKAVWSKFENE